MLPLSEPGGPGGASPGLRLRGRALRSCQVFSQSPPRNSEGQPAAGLASCGESQISRQVGLAAPLADMGKHDDESWWETIEVLRSSAATMSQADLGRLEQVTGFRCDGVLFSEPGRRLLGPRAVIWDAMRCWLSNGIVANELAGPADTLRYRGADICRRPLWEKRVGGPAGQASSLTCRSWG